MNKEIKIVPPEGYEIDVLNSNLECIKFKPIEKKRWRDNEGNVITGYLISYCAKIVTHTGNNTPSNYSIFATENKLNLLLLWQELVR